MTNTMADKNLIQEILNKKPLSKNDIISGRIDFCSNLNQIEIDITYDCNLKCKCCNRSCGEAPSSEKMSLDDIKKFISDSKENKRYYRLINILGGEPTLHPDFEEIIRMLQEDYADCFFSDVIIQVVSNGLTKKSRELCDTVESKFKNVRIDRASYKTNQEVTFFTPFSDAPVDDEKFKDSDFSKGCWVASYCGIGLNKNGYYGCAVCGAIDRVLNLNKGVKSISELTVEKQKEHFNLFCRLCGNFKYYAENLGESLLRCEKAPFKEIVSPVWKNLYSQYNSQNNEYF